MRMFSSSGSMFMSRVGVLVVGCMVALAPARGWAQVYSCADAPLSTNCDAQILDNQVVESSFAISPGACDPQATIVATGVRLKLSHQWVGDLSLSLVHPDGTEVLLMMRPGIAVGNSLGCAGEDVDAFFSDGANVTSTQVCAETFPSISGSFHPHNPLTALNGKGRSGTWSLRVSDGAGYGIGAVDSWTLALPCTLPDVTAVASQPLAIAGDRGGEITVTRSGDTLGPLPVRYTISGTADPSAYAPLSGVVTIPEGATSATIDIIASNGATVDSTVIATIEPGVVYAVGSPESATVTLTTCGNGTLDPGEQCDDADDSGTCTPTCTLVDDGDGDGDGDGGCGCSTRGGTSSASLFAIVAAVGLILRRRRARNMMPLLLGAYMLVAAGPAEAAIGTLDNVPAATLLYPYFEVETGAGTNDTLITVQNSGSSAVLTNVTIWSEMGVPVHHFHVYLTGYDVQSISLRALLVEGKVPRTATDGQDPSDTISPQGPVSQDINYASCAGVLPAADLPAATIADLKAALTGRSSTALGDKCAGPDHGDTIARGYVTIDAVNNCTARVPSMPGYFGAGGTGDATNQNLLLGDFFFIDAVNLHAQAQPAVHLEASSTDPRTSTPGRYTFYGRYVSWTAADNREPLATLWQVPFTTNETDVIVWRDSKISQEPFSCGTSPSVYPLGSQGLLAFDMQEGVTELSAMQPFTTDLTRTRIGGGALPVVSKNGTLVFSSNMPLSPGGPSFDPAAAQSYVMAIHYPGSRGGALTRFGTNIAAIAIDSATRVYHAIPPNETMVDPETMAVGPTKIPAIGVADVAPAATLLAPHFEVDTLDPNGVNTQIRLVNLFSSALLVHATLWTDYGIPTHRFNIYLTGYDSSLVDLRWIFQKGIVDLTASAGQDPANKTSPRGPLSQDLNFASCTGQLPPARLSSAAVTDLVHAHTGRASSVRFGGKCAGAPHGDSIARGYVTFDTVNNCTQRAPGDAGYFGAGGTGDATNQNHLSGSYTIIDRTQKLSVADTLVHIQASSTNPATATAGNPTFYGKFVAWSASDNREPLGTAWQARFIYDVAPGSLFAAFADGKTNFLVWRESPAVLSAFDCGTVPLGFPLPLRELLEFDEAEDVTALATNLGTFPLVSQRVSISDPTLAAAYASGFLSADLRAPVGSLGGPPSDPSRRGSFIAATHYAKALGYQVLLGGLQLQ
jgi:MYXO-CTERM domain-containing protein